MQLAYATENVAPRAKRVHTEYAAVRRALVECATDCRMFPKGTPSRRHAEERYHALMRQEFELYLRMSRGER